MDELRGKHRSRRPDRVAMSDGAAFEVDDIVGLSKLPRHDDGDCRERFIDLRALDRADLPTAAPQRLSDSRDWPKAEHAGLDRRNPVGDEPRARGEVAPFSPGLVC